MTTAVDVDAWYVAGPMSGIPQFNFPVFDAAAADLRAKGYTIVSPAELDSEETRQAALASIDGAPGTGSHMNETWGDFLARDLKLIADVVDGVIVLPGWEKSSGARTETFMAFVAKKPIVYYPTMEPVKPRDLALAWLRDWNHLLRDE